MQEARMISGADVDRLISEFRVSAEVATEHENATEHDGYSCARAVFASGYAAAMAVVLETLGLSESDVYGDELSAVITVTPEAPPFTASDVDAFDADRLVSALLGEGDA